MDGSGKKMSKLMIFLNVVLFPFSIIGAALFSRYLLIHNWKDCTGDVSKFVNQFSIKEVTFESKVEFLFSVMALTGAFVFVNTFMIMLCRMITQANPLTQKDPVIIQTLNRVIQNTLEQGFVFFGLFSFWVLKFVNESNKDLAQAYAIIFITSRIIFLIGYPIQSYLQLVTLRVGGFCVTLTVEFLLLGAITGHDLTSLLINGIVL